MSATRVSVLTPAGTGAIATVELRGPEAWGFCCQHFRTANGKPLPETPIPHRFWFGTLADGDEVILAVKQVESEACVEIHCHGGPRVVRWVVEQLPASGAQCGSTVASSQPNSGLAPAARLVASAPTLRTASILLDQFHGAFAAAIHEILDSPDEGHFSTRIADLAQFAPVGKHLVEPWKVVIAGEPNVGKSSLVNALAGYQRSVVSEIAGTTRDVVTVPLAFDGWPVEITDTAGIREASGLEAEGIERARRVLAEAELVVWLHDATAPKPAAAAPGTMNVINKVDAPPQWDLDAMPDALHVSARTGTGVSELVSAIVAKLVPHAPPPGAAVPFKPELAELLEWANAASRYPAECRRRLLELKAKMCQSYEKP